MADDAVVGPRSGGGIPPELQRPLLVELPQPGGQVGRHRVLGRGMFGVPELVPVPMEEGSGFLGMSLEEAVLYHPVGDEVLCRVEQLEELVPDPELGAQAVAPP